MAHYYKPDGTLIDKVPMTTREGLRDANIADARKMGLIPSVTTMMSIMDKPMVNIWRIEQGIKAVLTEPISGDEDWDAYIKRMVGKADEYSRYAAEFGTEIHNMVCNLLGGKRFESETPTFITAKRIAEQVAFWVQANYKVLEPERTFVNQALCIAGTIDLTAIRLSDGKPVILDFKTNDFEVAKDAPFYREHRWQLAGYALGDERPEDEREVVYISRKSIGLIVSKLCVEPSKDDAVFRSIVETWRAVNDWELPA